MIPITIRNFTDKIREILNTTEYGFHHSDRLNVDSKEWLEACQYLLNCKVTGKTYNEGLVATVNCRHRSFPKWKLETYLMLMKLVEELTDASNHETHFEIRFTGNVPNEPFTRSFSEQMKIDLC